MSEAQKRMNRRRRLAVYVSIHTGLSSVPQMLTPFHTHNRQFRISRSGSINIFAANRYRKWVQS